MGRRSEESDDGMGGFSSAFMRERADDAQGDAESDDGDVFGMLRPETLRGRNDDVDRSLRRTHEGVRGVMKRKARE